MAKQKKTFVPFAHDDLELKNQLIDYARVLSVKKDAEAQLASAMIYASFTEYIAGHLLDNMRYLMYQTTYNQYAGILFVDERDDSEVRMMGKTIHLLQKFSFPDKTDILRLLSEVSKSRNNLFHNFARADLEGLEVLNEDIQTIKERSEEIFQKVNTVYAGLQKILMPEQEMASDLTENDEKETKKQKNKPKK